MRVNFGWEFCTSPRPTGETAAGVLTDDTLIHQEKNKARKYMSSGESNFKLIMLKLVLSCH